MGGRVEFLPPQLLAAARVNRPEDAVDRRTDEHEIARGRDAATKARLAGHRNPFCDQLFELAERHAPRDVARVRIHRDQLTPGRLRTAVLVGRIPKPSTFRRDLAHVRHSRRGRARGHDAVRKIWRFATSASTAATAPAGHPETRSSRCPHCPAFITFVIIRPRDG